MIDHSCLREIFEYSEDGAFVERGKRKRHAAGEKTSGWVEGHGYRRLYVSGKTYLLHRLIYFYHHGVMPKFIDHIDGDKTNNRIENLRECTHAENMANRRKLKVTSSKYRGVVFLPNRRAWAAIGRHNKKSYYIGYFKNENEAAEAFNEFAKEKYGAFARLNIIDGLPDKTNGFYG